MIAAAGGLAACELIDDGAVVDGDELMLVSGTADQEPVVAGDEPRVPCAPVVIDTVIHATEFQTGVTARVAQPQAGGYLWEFIAGTDNCQGVITSGQGTSAITFTAGVAGCTMQLRTTDAQNCSGRRKLQVDFKDVTLFHTFIDRVAVHDVIDGCGLGNFCPQGATTREEMARMLLRGQAVMRGDPDYQPAACVPTSQRIFEDVPFTNPFCPWVEKLHQDHVTGGCSTNPSLYCPTQSVSRAQMAVFLLRTLEGPSFRPTDCVPGAEMFGDVSASDIFCPWIEELARRAITGGCSSSPSLYCPGVPVTRGQMSVFVDRTFRLDLQSP